MEEGPLHRRTVEICYRLHSPVVVSKFLHCWLKHGGDVTQIWLHYFVEVAFAPSPELFFMRSLCVLEEGEGGFLRISLLLISHCGCRKEVEESGGGDKDFICPLATASVRMKKLLHEHLDEPWGGCPASDRAAANRGWINIIPDICGTSCLWNLRRQLHHEQIAHLLRNLRRIYPTICSAGFCHSIFHSSELPPGDHRQPIMRKMASQQPWTPIIITLTSFLSLIVCGSVTDVPEEDSFSAEVQ